MCRLCQRADDDPEVFGETCQQDGLCIHENCLVSPQGVQPPAPDPVPAAAHPTHIPGSLLQYHASGLSQQGDDGEGFFGFLFPDIHQELQRVAQKVRRGGDVSPPRSPCPWVGMLQQPAANSSPQPCLSKKSLSLKTRAF